MNSKPGTTQLSRHNFAPRWTWRSVMFAAVITLAVYLLLPYLEMLAHPERDALEIRNTDTVELPPVPPRPRSPLHRKQTSRPKPPKPELQKLNSKMVPLQMQMNLSMALGDVGSDFAVDFSVQADALSEQIGNLIFEVAELDEPPQILMRLRPVYPPKARIRQLEGFAELEFIVGSDGSVSEIIVINSSPPGIFDQAAIRAVKGWRFSAGIKDGQPVITRVRQKITFRLD